MVLAWISIAFIAGLLVQRLSLPPLIGYLLAGFALSTVSPGDHELLQQLAHAGVLLLLFSVGLKLQLGNILQKAVFTGTLLHLVANIALIVPPLYFLLGMEIRSSLLLAVALSFSSTVVAAKILEAKRELRAFHGRLAIGVLVVQDLIAVLVLSMAGEQTPSPWAALLLLLPLTRPLLIKILEMSGHEELLLLFGLVMALVVGGYGFEIVGLSSELGALLCGVLLANHAKASELAKSLWGLKEIFLIGFFLQIGMAGLPDLQALVYALLLTLFIPIKGLLFFLVLLLFNLRARTAFLTGISLATYSEFGLIVANMGVKQQWLDNYWLSVFAVAVALSFAIASPITRFGHTLYSRYGRRLKVFESIKKHPDELPINLGNSHVLIMGMGRVGTGAYDMFSQRKLRVIGMDSDQNKVRSHLHEGRRVVYADAEDPGLWQGISLEGINAVLLATPDFEANRMAAVQLRQKGYRGLIASTVLYREQTQKILDAGADVVYNYYDQVGFGFAEHVWELLYPGTTPTAS